MPKKRTVRCGAVLTTALKRKNFFEEAKRSLRRKTRRSRDPVRELMVEMGFALTEDECDAYGIPFPNV